METCWVMTMIMKPSTYLKNVTATSFPVIDYNYVHNKPVFGGELSFNVNALALQINDPANALPIPNLPNVTSGVTDHIATDMQWRRTLKDDFGEVFTPFVFARADVYNVSSFTDITGNSGAADTFTRQLAGIGLDYRYPFVANTEGASHVIEPIAQIIARGGAANNNMCPTRTRKALSSTILLLFDINKFSGYDQIETGTRTNFGVQYTMQAYNGISIRTVAGESIQLAGPNAFA